MTRERKRRWVAIQLWARVRAAVVIMYEQLNMPADVTRARAIADAAVAALSGERLGLPPGDGSWEVFRDRCRCRGLDHDGDSYCAQGIVRWGPCRLAEHCPRLHGGRT